jgi:ParB-like chromosome segregation protein Spo0J
MNKIAAMVLAKARAAFSGITALDEPTRVEVINALRKDLHAASPFKNEPVDLVQWIRADLVAANDYNPNSVAPPEMKLLEHSITQDGYTQPIVTWQNGTPTLEVIDGFHRNRVGKESKVVRTRTRGYLPVVIMNATRTERNDRIAATIRHNRARGKHKVDAMSGIVVELKRRNWSDDRICRELGMDQDEVLRLCQITGLAELFSNQEFSKSWDVVGEITDADYKELTDDITTYGPETTDFRTVNTSDDSRIFHTHDKWECYRAGFYASSLEGVTKTQAEEAYRDFLGDSALFADALEGVIGTWTHSCEHYLTNIAMNRIAWLGQAAACYALGLPAVFRSGFYLLTEAQQTTANELALVYLNRWLEANGRAAVTMEEAYSYERQSDIY